jgi:hypothetical protein
MPMHIAFAAESRAQARAFHRGDAARRSHRPRPPGIRQICRPYDYGALVIGPDGHNIEAVRRAEKS